MSTRRSRRNVDVVNMDVVDLMSSDDDEEEMDRKPPARKEKTAEVIDVLDDSDEEEITVIPRSAAKRRHPPLELDDEIEVLDVKKPSGCAKAGLPHSGRTHAAASLHFENNDGYSVSSRRQRHDINTDLDADEELARELQKEEEERSSSSSREKLSSKTCHDADIEFARRLHLEDEKTQKKRESLEKKDAKIAASLHWAEEKDRDERKVKELDSMKNSKAGRSVLLIEKIIKVIEQHSSTDDLEPVAKDDAVYMAENMMGLQETFKTEGRNTHVGIGYHYTKNNFLESIRTDGLLTVEDRMARKHTNTKNTAVFGNGIYTATNPLGFTVYGDVGLLLAVLKGKERVFGPYTGAGPPPADPGIDTVIGNKTGDAPFHDEVILKKSLQCVPLVKFKTSKINDLQFADMVWSIHQQIQQVLDEYFNESITTTVNRVTPGSRLPAATITTAPPTAASVRGMFSSNGVSLPMPPAPAAAGGFAAGTSFFSMPGAATGGMPSMAFGFGGMPSSAFPPGVASAMNMALSSIPGLPPMGFGGTSGPMLSSSAPTAAASVAGVTSGTRPIVRRRVRRSRGPPRSTAHVRRSVQASTNETISYTAPETMVVSTNTAALLPVTGRNIGVDDCSICLCQLADGTPVVQAKCKHMFHEVCIKACLKHDVKCPECRKSMTDSGAVQGRGPSGIMTVTTSSSDISGFTNVGSIMIHYQLHGGVQKDYHPNPRVAYGGDARMGYLPNDSSGQDLLKRLKYAFRHGLTFSIGTSLTTHQPNVIVWGSIHHKTSMHGGPHGWPDPHYFANANSELDGAGVPPASQL